MFDNLDVSPGIIINNDIQELNPNLSLESQLDSLKEDLFQVVFDDKIVLDAGWYSDGSIDGEFVIYLLENEDWDNPMERKTVHSFEELRSGVQELLAVAKQIVARQNNSDDGFK